MPTSPVQYQYLAEQDIHELIYYESSRRAAEAGLAHILEIYNNATEAMTIRMLLDFRLSGFLPFNTMISQERNWTKNVKVHPNARLAILTQHDTMISLVTTIFKTMRFGHLHTQIFPGDTRDEAVAWLLKEGQ